jgi:hypothetical protein
VLGVGQVGEACRESEVILLKKQVHIFNKINAHLSENNGFLGQIPGLRSPVSPRKHEAFRGKEKPPEDGFSMGA